MRPQHLLYLFLGAIASTSAVELTERQAPRPINIDLYLPETTFLALGSSSVLQSVLLGAGYGSVSSNYLSGGAGSLSRIFSQSTTPLNTFVGQHLPPLISQGTNNNTKYNYSTNALAAGFPSGYATTLAGLAANGESATAGMALASFVGFSERDTAIVQAAAAYYYGPVFDTSAESSTIPTADGYSIRESASLPTQSITRQHKAGLNETVAVGVCTAQSTGAYAYASYNTTTTIPINGSSYGTPIVASNARTFCLAGTPDPKDPLTSASDFGLSPRREVTLIPGITRRAPQQQPAYALVGVLAVPKQKGGAQTFVNCNGYTRNGLQLVKYRVQIQGTFASNTGFVGNITGIRQALSTATCS